MFHHVCLASLLVYVFYLGFESIDIEILRKSNCCFLSLLLLELAFCSCGCLLFGLLKDYFLVFSRAWFLSLYWFFFCYYPLKGWICGNILCNLVLSWKILVSPSMVIENFAGCSSLGWHLCSLGVYITSALDLLAFIVSGEKSGVILIDLPLYVT